MLLPFFYILRAFKIPVGTQEWLALMEALIRNIHDSSLNRFYYLARSILVKSEENFDAYDQAFLMCFKGREGDVDIKKEIYEWLNKMVDPSQRPAMPQIPPLTLEELKKQFLERLKEQMEEHHGGNRWIGTGGTSPFGHSGSHPSGIRIGGPGGGRSAIQVAEERRFQNYRYDRTLDIRQFKVALKRLRKLDRLGHVEELSLEKTIDKTCKNAGDIELVFEPEKKNQAELLLLMDVGGSMDPHIELMESIFTAAHASTHFKAFHHFYYHNCIYSKVFSDMNRQEYVSTEELFRLFRGSFRLVIVGDACMSPYELFAQGGAIDYWENNPTSGVGWLKKIKDHYPSSVWLNPEPEDYWGHITIKAIRKLFKMYPLTVKGLTDAVDDLRGDEVRAEKIEMGRVESYYA